MKWISIGCIVLSCNKLSPHCVHWVLYQWSGFIVITWVQIHHTSIMCVCNTNCSASYLKISVAVLLLLLILLLLLLSLITKRQNTILHICSYFSFLQFLLLLCIFLLVFCYFVNCILFLSWFRLFFFYFWNQQQKNMKQKQNKKI